MTRQLLIVPTRTLEARWYAIEINLERPVTGSLRAEGRQVSRFRPDSHPVFQGVATTTRDGTHLLEARFSERVASDVPAGAWVIEDDSGPLRCAVDGPEPGQEETRATWVCDRERVGQLRIDFGGVLTTVGGEPLHDVQGEVLTRVSVGETTLESEGVLLLR